MPHEGRRSPIHDSDPRPRVPASVRTVTETLFSALARLRSARPFHPVGRSFTATLTPIVGQGPDFLGVDARPALVRFSNAAGLPPRFPDVLGLAVRIPDGAGPGRPQDLLLSSSSDPPVLRHLLCPARGFSTPRYSSLLLYRHGGALELIGARYRHPSPRHPLRLADLDRAAAEEALTFTLDRCTPTGAWRPFALLQAHTRLSPTDSRRLRFHPWNTAVQLRPVGVINHLRAPAYEASQRTATSE